MRTFSNLSYDVIGASIEVHRHLGPGLLESTYQACLCYELTHRGISFRPQVDLPVVYKGIQLDCGYRIDALVGDKLIVELKAVETVLPVHIAQTITYMRLGGYSEALLINFNVTSLHQGVRNLTLKDLPDLPDLPVKG